MVQDFYEDVERGLLRQLFLGVAYADLTPVKISLHTDEPGPTGTNEVAGGSYVRVQVDTDKWTTPVGVGAGSATFNVEDLEFAGMPTTIVAHVGIWSNDGTIFMMSAPLAAAQNVTSGATYTILAGKLQVRLN